MKIHFLILVFGVLAVVAGVAKDAVVIDKKVAAEILDKYAAAANISAQVEKSDEKLVLGTKSVNAGEIKYSGGHLYLALNGDKKAELFFKNGKLTLVDYPDVDFDPKGKRKVTVMTKNTPPLLTSLTNLFSNSKNFFKEFAVQDSSSKENIVTLNLKPKSKSMKNFKLKLDKDAKTIQSIEFTDDVETLTQIIFKDVNLSKKIPKSAFEYKIQKSDQVVTQ